MTGPSRRRPASGDRAATGRPVSGGRPATERAATDRAATDRPRTDRPATGRAATDRAATDRAASDRPGTSGAAARRPTARRSAAVRDGYHHGDLRRALLAAARQVLAAEGPEGCSLREVARRAGVSHAAPYHHFTAREAMLGALAAEGFDELDRAMAEAQAAAPTEPAAQLVAVGMGYFLLAQRQPELFRLMIRPEHLAPPAPPGSPAPRRPPPPAGPDACARDGLGPYGRLQAALARLLGRAAGDDEVHLCWSAVHGLSLLALDGGLGVPPGALAAHARSVLERLAAGVRAAGLRA